MPLLDPARMHALRNRLLRLDYGKVVTVRRDWGTYTEYAVASEKAGVLMALANNSEPSEAAVEALDLALPLIESVLALTNEVQDKADIICQLNAEMATKKHREGVVCGLCSDAGAQLLGENARQEYIINALVKMYRKPWVSQYIPDSVAVLQEAESIANGVEEQINALKAKLGGDYPKSDVAPPPENVTMSWFPWVEQEEQAEE